MPYFYAKDERVLVDGFKFGTVYQDQDHNDEVVHVFLDRAKNVVKSYRPSQLQPMSAEEEAFLNIQLNQPVKVVRIDVDEILNLGRKDGEEAEFRLKIGDRVRFKHNRKNGTVRSNEMFGDTNIMVEWDRKDGGKDKAIWEHIRDLAVLYAPRATDTDDEAQATIDQIDAIRLPLIAEIEKKQAILSKLTAAKKILQKG